MAASHGICRKTCLLIAYLAAALVVVHGYAAQDRQKVRPPTDASSDWNRRSLLHCGPLGAFLISMTSVNLPAMSGISMSCRANAVGEGSQRMVLREKPTAPVGALLPAIQQRLLLEAALELAKQQKWEELQRILPPLEDYNSNRKADVQLFQKYNPAKVLRGDVLRAALNLYQTNLNYNNLLTAPTTAFTVTDPEWKKSYIRANDGLPDLSKVIGADLDLRQLLRNQIQERIDDAAAELYANQKTSQTSICEKSSSDEGCDPDEVVRLLQEAANTFDQWLDRVRSGDVQEVLQAALAGQSIRVYDSSAAGFLPPSPSQR